MLFSGLYTALITPFKDGKVDEKSLESLIEFQVKNGVSGIIPCGTTGESPTLSHDEHNLVVELAVKIAAGRIQVIAGTGSNSTSEAVMMTKHAKKVGADGCLVVAPYYNKPSQKGLYEHFKAVSKCGLPVIIYNIPGRSVIDISDATIAQLAQLPNISGLKDATGDLARVAALRALLGEKSAEFSLLSGEDATAVGFNAMGGNGVVSVTSNVAPHLCANLQNATLKGDFKTALKLQDKLSKLHAAMFCQTSPAPVKYAASLMGLCQNEVRLPLVNLTNEGEDLVKKELKKVEL